MKTVVSAANTTKNAGSANLTSAVTIIPKTTNTTTTATDNAQLQFPMPEVTSNVAGNSKRPASLDLNINKSAQAKKSRLVGPSPLILESPDLQNAKILNTPDLEKILLSSNMLQTPQPGSVLPTKVGPVTSEQEAFGKGFEEALHSLHTSMNSQANLISSTGSATAVTAAPLTTTTTIGMSGGSFTYTNLETSFPVAIKDEPQNPSSPPPVNPIDMESQEKIKLERKRQRNRVAASKCRKRKLERISKLEEKVKSLKTENSDLGSVVKHLKDHVAQLKEKVMQHFNSGCNIPTIYNGSPLLQGK